jgi:replication-associated recombination protein RarA
MLFDARLEPKQSGLAFPQSLTEAYKPQTLDEFCGLEKQKKILSNLAANPRPCALLFEGASGTGKTCIAYAFARKIVAEVHHIGSQEATVENVKEIVRMCQYVPLSGGSHVVIMDEADRMSPATQLYLLSKFDGTEQCPHTIWILTCNCTESLQDRFLSRCIKLPKFNSYGAGESVRQLLGRIWRERAGNAAEPDYSKATTANVREALQWLEVELLAA